MHTGVAARWRQGRRVLHSCPDCDGKNRLFAVYPFVFCPTMIFGMKTLFTLISSLRHLLMGCMLLCVVATGVLAATP